MHTFLLGRRLSSKLFMSLYVYKTAKRQRMEEPGREPQWYLEQSPIKMFSQAQRRWMADAWQRIISAKSADYFRNPGIHFFDGLVINFIQGCVFCFAFFISPSLHRRGIGLGGRHKVDNCGHCARELFAPRSTALAP